MSKFLAENTKNLDRTIMDEMIDRLDQEEIGLLDLVAIDGIVAREEEKISLQEKKHYMSSGSPLNRCNSSKIVK